MSHIDEFDLNNICRTCLATENLKPLHSTKDPFVMLTLCTSMECYVNDGLPVQMCTDCITELKRSYTFALKCRESDNKLREYIQKYEKHIYSFGSKSLKETIKCSKLRTDQNLDVVHNELDVTIKTEPIDSFDHEKNLTPVTFETVKIEPPVMEFVDMRVATQEEQPVANKPILIEILSHGPQELESPAARRKRLDRERYLRHRSALSEAELSAIRLKNRERNRRSRSALTEDELNIRRQLGKECGQQYRSAMREDDLNYRRLLDRERHRQFRSALTKEQIEARRLLDRERHRKFRTSLTEEQIAARKLIDRQRYHQTTDYTSSNVHKHHINGEIEIQVSKTVQRLYSCKSCDTSFAQKINLNQKTDELKKHLRPETGERPFLCTICNKSFARKGILNIHIRSHTKEKPYSCPVCDKSFCEKSKVTRHMWMHTDHKPHLCVVCNKSFGQKVHLKNHMRIHTGEKPFPCPICHKFFNQKKNLTAHKRSQHKDVALFKR